MDSRQKINGFGLIGIILTLAIIALLGGGGWYLKEQQSQKNVVQMGAQAEQQALALKEKIEAAEKSPKVSVKTPAPMASSTVMAGWKTYRNEQYGFEVKYPSGLVADLKNRGYMSGSDYFGHRNFNVLILNPKIEPSVLLPFGDVAPNPKYDYDGYNFAVFSGDAAKNHVKNLDELRDSYKDNLETMSVYIGDSNYEIYTIKLGPPHTSFYSFTHFPGSSYEVLVEGGYDKEVFRQILSTFKFTK